LRLIHLGSYITNSKSVLQNHMHYGYRGWRGFGVRESRLASLPMVLLASLHSVRFAARSDKLVEYT
jgi:hypothetical protein